MPKKTVLAVALPPSETPSPSLGTPVVESVVTDFLSHLDKDSTVPAEVIARLRGTLLAEKDFSVEALRAALFDEGVA